MIKKNLSELKSIKKLDMTNTPNTFTLGSTDENTIQVEI